MTRSLGYAFRQITILLDKSPWRRHGVSREINVDVAVIALIMSMFCRFYLSAAGTPRACHLEELVENSEGPAVVAYDL